LEVNEQSEYKQAIIRAQFAVTPMKENRTVETIA